jgi:integrase
MRLAKKSQRTGRDLKRGSVNRELSILRAMLRLAADEDCGYLEKAPRVKLEREDQGRLRFLSDHECERLLAECRKSGQPLLYTIVVIALNTGMRKSEILGLEWDRIDVSRGVLQLEETKNGTRREIPMNQAVYDVLSALPKSGRRLFPSSIRRAFENAVERAGVKDFRFHDLRHTFASWLTMKGRPLREVQELLGHKSIYMTQRYSHLAPERLREAVAVLDNTMSAHRPFEATQLPATVG